MSPRKKTRFCDEILGPMPVDSVYKAVGLELDDGYVKCAAHALKHANNRHPGEVEVIHPHLATIVTKPLYISDDARNPDKVSLIGRIPGKSGGALVAVTVSLDKHGFYNVASMYLISQSDIDKKRDKGILKNAK